MEKKKDKFESILKFTAMGLAGMAISAGVAFKDDLVNTYDKNKMFSEIVVSLKEEIKNGLGKSEFRTIEIKTGVEYQNKKNVWGSFATTDSIESGLCTFILTAGGSVDKMVEVQPFYQAQKEEMDIVNSIIQTRDDIAKVVEMTGYHEGYHCDEEVGNGQRFNIKGKPELSASLNALYNGGAIDYTQAMLFAGNDGKTLLMDGNLDTLISEGIAETGSSIVMARKYQENARNVLTHRQILSGGNRVGLTSGNDYALRKHTTDGINEYYRSDEGLREASQLKTVEQVRERAWEMANTNMLQALKSRGDTAKLLNDRYWNTETLNFWKTQIIAQNKNLPNSLTPLMMERVDELKSKLPQDLKDKFEAIVMKENKNDKDRGVMIEAFNVYKDILENFPKLTAGAKEINLIQEQLPQAVKEVKANPIYELKSLKDVIAYSGVDVSPNIELKIDVKSNRKDEVVAENNKSLKM